MFLEVQPKAGFPTIYLLLSAGLTIGISTATCEQVSPVWWGYSHFINV